MAIHRHPICAVKWPKSVLTAPFLVVNSEVAVGKVNDTIRDVRVIILLCCSVMVISIRFVELVGLFTLTAAISSHLPTNGFKSNGCPLGWSPYKDCCYFFENRTMTLPKAEKQCSTRGATLIVANSEQELSNVTQLAGRNHLFWVGLAQFEQHSPPVWQTTSGVEPTKLNWLVKPFSSTLNGWSTVSRCAAFFNGHTESARYLYFHPCESHFQSICERNLTFSSALSQNFGK